MNNRVEVLKVMHAISLNGLGCVIVFFFQAEDGIRDLTVTGVQTCALPISFTGAMGQGSSHALGLALGRPDKRVIVLDGDGSLLMNLGTLVTIANAAPKNQIGRASCRERV